MLVSKQILGHHAEPVMMTVDITRENKYSGNKNRSQGPLTFKAPQVTNLFPHLNIQKYQEVQMELFINGQWSVYNGYFGTHGFYFSARTNQVRRNLHAALITSAIPVKNITIFNTMVN